MISSVFIVFLVFCFVLVKSDDESRHPTSSRMTYPNDFSVFYENPHDYHHSHHHNPHHQTSGYYPYRDHTPHRRHYYEDEDDVDDSEGLFRSKPRNDAKNNEQNITNEIPLDFIQNINKYNVSDLLLNFVEGDAEYDEPFILNRFGEDGVARNAAVIPKAAGCMPELKTVNIATSDDPSILYIPQCTRVERCGGCCSHTLLSCQPKETETISYQVMKTQYTGEKKLKFLGKEVVVIEKHTKCKCDCKIKEEHCNKYQQYRPSECRCACTNTDEEKKCNKSGLKKLWNPELCACQCRDFLDCSTGYIFDQNECRCTPTPMKRRFADYERRGYNSEGLTIAPLDEDN